MFSLVCAKVAVTAILGVLLCFLVDTIDRNGNPQVKTKKCIAIPGGLMFVVAVIAFALSLLGVIWGF